MRALARIGLAARGLLYIIVGWLALQIAFGHSRQQADRTGALHTIAGTRLGGILLWVLVVGFFGLALWRLSEAAYGTPAAGGHKTSTRLLQLARAIFYGFVAYGMLKYALGTGGPQSSNQQSVDLTAAALKYPGGKLVVVLIGLGFIAGGVYLAWKAWKRSFRKHLQTGQMSPRTRKVVDWLGTAGGIARGVVFTTAGIFLVVAAVRSQPSRAKGIDSALRALAATPLGPWLLALVALGLIMFGVFSWCLARWFRY